MKVALAATLSVLLFSSSLHAQPITDIPSGADRIITLRKGETSPFDGQLFDNPTALRWGNWLLQYKFRLAADVEFQKKLGAADVDLWSKKYDLLSTQYKVVTDDYQKQLTYWQGEATKYRELTESTPWYKSVWFGVTLGVVVTGAAVGLGAYAVHATK